MIDERNIASGSVIPSEGYCDQPYVAKLSDGSWLCVMTTGEGHEGEQGQHIVSCRSTDFGRTWSSLTDIEPGNGPEASWAMPMVTLGGRVYVFYTYNASDLREARSGDADGYVGKRVDNYDVNLPAAIGYPDFVEAGDRLFITETQKSVARVHEVPQWLLERLWEK